MRNPFSRKNVTAMQVLSDESTYATGACYVVGMGVVSTASLNRGCNITWLADQVYDMRTNSIRNLADERYNALQYLQLKHAAREDLIERLSSDPVRRALRRS